MHVKTVVLIDDVCTTGTQLNAVAGVLLDEGGARRSSSPGSRPVARRHRLVSSSTLSGPAAVRIGLSVLRSISRNGLAGGRSYPSSRGRNPLIRLLGGR